MRQDPSNPYFFYTIDGEHITIVVKSIKTSPLVVGFGPPSFIAHPPDPDTNTRTFEFTETNPPDVDVVGLNFSFVGKKSGAKYTVTIASSEGGEPATVPPLIQVPGITIQHMGLIFLKNDQVQP